MILEKLKSHQRREPTMKAYYGTWKHFNEFIIRLDIIPRLWEDRASLYDAYLVHEKGVQSSTLKSYISAIKAILVDDGYPWNDNRILLSTLTKSCRLINDRVKTQLPIQVGLMEMLLFEVQHVFRAKGQYYLEILYKTMFIVAYYGLFRISEIAAGTHPVKANDVHVGRNKDKLLFYLRTSKTHGKESRPQKIKISAKHGAALHTNRYFCPFKLSREYLALRGNYKSDHDPFFIYRDNTPVTQANVRKILRDSLQNINLEPRNYGFHSFRIGRSTDLIKFGKSLSYVKLAGRWKSNVVYKYIR